MSYSLNKICVKLVALVHTLFVSVSLVYTIHFTFFVHPHSSFMGCSRQYGDKENHKSALTLLFDVFLLTLDVSGIVGICMLFTKDERSRKIIAFATGSLSHLQLQPSRSPLGILWNQRATVCKLLRHGQSQSFGGSSSSRGFWCQLPIP